jgi:uncharacterized membrane protein
MKRLTTASLRGLLPWVLIVCGSLGLIAAGIIMLEKIHLLQDPHFVPSCDLNPIVSCGSVMASNQSHVFGFPNPLLGLVGFPVLITTGVLLLAGGQLKRWYMRGLLAGTIFGVGFVQWLFFQSVYHINALCPYCMVVWVVTITSFWYVLLYCLSAGHLIAAARLVKPLAFAQRHHLDILLAWLLVIAGLILHHFWYYFGPALGFGV